MEKKKIDFGKMAVGAGKSMSELWSKTKEKVVKAADQNGDGELDLQDATVIADAISTAASNTITAVKEGAEAKRREIELKMMQPIFAEDLDSADFLMPKLIRITEMDKKHAESEVCKGSIGYVSVQKDFRIVNVFRDKVDAFGISFYPDIESEIYYVDPSDRDHYISLDEYFAYMKIARINELQKIAQDLGAKHFRVTFVEKKTTFTEHKVNGKMKLQNGLDRAETEAAHELSEATVASMEIAAEMECPGHPPMTPKLFYLQREPSIQTLVALRMDPNSPLTHQKYTLQLSNSCGIKEKDALKIDAALKSMKLAGNSTVASEAKNEARRYFEYEIDF